MPTVWMNGQLIDEDDARVSVRDLGLLHGAGVFTTMRADAGAVFDLAANLARLRHSCEAFSIPLVHGDDELRDAAAALLADNGLLDARLRLTVTRGVQGIDPVHGPVARPNVFMIATALEPYAAELYERGMTVLAHDAFKLNPYDPQAGHKTLDYLSRFGALRAAQQGGANEAMLFDVHNYLQSGAIGNVFLVKGGRLFTPPTDAELGDEAVRAATPYPKSNVLPGITRAHVLGTADDAGIDVERCGLSISDLLDADEVFLTNSLMRVMPVCRVERKAIGDGRPGPVTQRLASLAFQAGER